MEDHVNAINSYLPIFFKDQDTENYIIYLNNACSKNADAELYQFTFLAFHLLFMSYVYKVIWFLHNQKPEYVSTFFSANNLENATHLYQLSTASEKNALKALAKLVPHQNSINEFCMSVERRDHCAHAAGYIQYKFSQIENFINEELGHMDKIQNGLISLLNEMYVNFIYEKWNPIDRDYLLPHEEVESFMRSNFLSSNDLNIVLDIDLPELHQKSSSERVIYIKCLYLSLIDTVQTYLGLEENVFLKKLPLLVEGFNEQNELSLSRVLLDNFHNIIPRFTDQEFLLFKKITRINIERV